jgi:steroid delta-isomerase-like uncharacterized protein
MHRRPTSCLKWPTRNAIMGRVTVRAMDPSGRLGYGPGCRFRATPAPGQRRGHASRGQQAGSAAVLPGGHQRPEPGRPQRAAGPRRVDHTFGSQNAEQAKQFFGMVHQAFPDLHAEVHDVIAEGELVAARVTYTGTHQGEFLGIPATGKQTTTNGVDLFRMQDGRQAEHWGGPDMFSFLVQLGVMPGPGTPA